MTTPRALGLFWHGTGNRRLIERRQSRPPVLKLLLGRRSRLQHLHRPLRVQQAPEYLEAPAADAPAGGAARVRGRPTTWISSRAGGGRGALSSGLARYGSSLCPAIGNLRGHGLSRLPFSRARAAASPGASTCRGVTVEIRWHAVTIPTRALEVLGVAEERSDARVILDGLI